MKSNSIEELLVLLTEKIVEGNAKDKLALSIHKELDNLIDTAREYSKDKSLKPYDDDKLPSTAVYFRMKSFYSQNEAPIKKPKHCLIQVVKFLLEKTHGKVFWKYDEEKNEVLFIIFRNGRYETIDQKQAIETAQYLGFYWQAEMLRVCSLETDFKNCDLTVLNDKNLQPTSLVSIGTWEQYEPNNIYVRIESYSPNGNHEPKLLSQINLVYHTTETHKTSIWLVGHYVHIDRFNDIRNHAPSSGRIIFKKLVKSIKDEYEDYKDKMSFALFNDDTHVLAPIQNEGLIPFEEQFKRLDSVKGHYKGFIFGEEGGYHLEYLTCFIENNGKVTLKTDTEEVYGYVKAAVNNFIIIHADYQPGDAYSRIVLFLQVSKSESAIYLYGIRTHTLGRKTRTGKIAFYRINQPLSEVPPPKPIISYNGESFFDNQKSIHEFFLNEGNNTSYAIDIDIFQKLINTSINKAAEKSNVTEFQGKYFVATPFFNKELDEPRIQIISFEIKGDKLYEKNGDTMVEIGNVICYTGRYLHFSIYVGTYGTMVFSLSDFNRNIHLRKKEDLVYCFGGYIRLLGGKGESMAIMLLNDNSGVESGSYTRKDEKFRKMDKATKGAFSYLLNQANQIEVPRTPNRLIGNFARPNRRAAFYSACYLAMTTAQSDVRRTEEVKAYLQEAYDAGFAPANIAGIEIKKDNWDEEIKDLSKDLQTNKKFEDELKTSFNQLREDNLLMEKAIADDGALQDFKDEIKLIWGRNFLPQSV